MKPYNKSNISFARKLRSNMTPWERKLWYDFLRGYPLRFQRQKPLGNYVADFYCARASLVVELDGGGHYTEQQRRHDPARTRALEMQGLRVLRFSNLDIDRDFYSVCECIDRAVNNSVSGYSGVAADSGDSVRF